MPVIKLEDNLDILDQVSQIENQYDHYEWMNSTIEKVMERIIDRVDAGYHHWIMLEWDIPWGFTYGCPWYWESYKGSWVFVLEQFTWKGIWRILVQTQIEYARILWHSSMWGIIDCDNAASIALHKKLGFDFYRQSNVWEIYLDLRN